MQRTTKNVSRFRMLHTIGVLSCVVAFSCFCIGCGDDKKSDDHDHDHSHDHDHDHDHDHEKDHSHDHEHGHDEADHGPHDGMVAELRGSDGKAAGFVELKLHDDKGDLELFLATDKDIKTPMLVSVDSTIRVTLIMKSGTKSVILAVRDRESNPDEDGHAHMDGDNTDYFIFPGETGADSKWLMGKEFQAQAKVFVKTADAQFESVTFKLIPHTHAEGAHAHK